MSNAFATFFAAGTILSCPSCGEGLYKLVQRSTTEDVVMDDGTLTVPLNSTILPRHAWTPVACPFCGGRLFKEGRLHTLQQGWRSRCLTSCCFVRHSAVMSLAFSAALFGLTITGFVAVGITAYLLGAPHPEVRFTASVLTLLIAALVAFTPLLLLAANPEARAALRDRALRHAQEAKTVEGTPQDGRK